MRYIRKLFLVSLSIVVLTWLAACGSAAVTPDPNAAKPSNPGGTGKALTLTGNAQNGAKVFADNCAQCHGDQGKGGVVNEGSKDGTIPALNPIDETLKNKDPKVFAANIDLFIEHGSTPEGNQPTRIMMPFGDGGMLEPQQIADVIAYVISLNQ
jgi:mono/diheme cytochrome c family protein